MQNSDWTGLEPVSLVISKGRLRRFDMLNVKIGHNVAS